jgi:YVTN family beta-propeller protein
LRPYSPAAKNHQTAAGMMPRTSLSLTLALAVAIAAAGCAAQTSQPASGVTGALSAPQLAGELLYVCNQNDASVSIIDMGTNRVVRTVDLQKLGFSANAKPHHVVVEPDGSFWYVTLIGDNRIVKLDRNDRVIAQVTFETPGMMSLHPTQDWLYVGRSMTAVNPPQRIGVLRRSDMKLEEVPVLFPRPHAIGLEPRTGTVYTASLAVNQIAAVDPATETVKLQDVPGPAHALMQYALSPDGTTMVISAELSHRVFVFDITNRLQPKLAADIDVGAQPFDPLFTADGRWVYLGNKSANTITVIDMSTRKVAKVIEGNGISQPHGIATSPDGRFIYVSNNNLTQPHNMADHSAHAATPAPAAAAAGPGTVVVIDTRTQSIAGVIEVGHNASGIGTRTRRQ